MPQPDFNLLLCQTWGYGVEVAIGLGCASNVVVGTNPPWSATDFFTFFPKFGGVPAAITGTLTNGVPIITGIASTAGLAIGQPVSGTGILDGSTVLAVNSGTEITLNQDATATGSQTLSVYNATLLPLAVINAYIALASASVVQARWKDTWAFAMALYVAHFCTLWLQSDANLCNNPGQAAAAGLQRGITVSKSVGGVSQGLQAVTGLDDWAAWTLTTYGLQFCTFAKGMGAGPLFLY